MPSVEAPPAPRLLQPREILVEALSIVPWVHVPIGDARRVLLVGFEAARAAPFVLRFPEVQEVAIWGGAPPAPDRRQRVIGDLSELASGWSADLVVMTVRGPPRDVLASLRRVVPTGITCVALERFADASSARALLRPMWREVSVYREHLPEPTAFLLASNLPIERRRPVPGVSRRYTDKYLPALFTFAKDEYQTIFGAAG